jgi:ketosteroid isomerase-like protein
VPDAATVQRIRTSFEAFFQGDLDAAVEMLAPDAIGVDVPTMPDAGTLHGRDEIKARIGGFRELFGDLELIEITIDEVAGRLLAVLSLRGRALAADMPVELLLAYLLRMDEGLVAELRAFLTEADARDYAASL